MLEAGWVPSTPTSSTSSTCTSASTPQSPEELARRSSRPAPARQAARRHRARPAQPAPRRARRCTTRSSDVLVAGRGRGDHADARRRGGDRGAVGPRGHRPAAPARRRGAATCPGRGAATPVFVIGVHAKSLRASMDPLPVVEVLAERCRELPGARLRVDAHTDVMTPGYAPARPRRRCRACASSRDARPGRPARARLLHRRRAVGLPPVASTCRCCPTASARTRAGWRRATTSARRSGADCGYYAEQRPCLTYRARTSRPRRRRRCATPSATRVRAAPALAGRPGGRRASATSARRAPTSRSTPAVLADEPAACTSWIIAAARYPIARAVRRRPGVADLAPGRGPARARAST